MPSQVEFKISEDGKHYESLDLIRNQISQKEEGSILHEFKTSQNFKCRFIQIKAKMQDPCRIGILEQVDPPGYLRMKL